MDLLLDRVQGIPEDGEVSSKVLLEWIEDAHNAPDALINDAFYEQCLNMLTGDEHIGTSKVLTLLGKVVSGFTESFAERMQMNPEETNGHTDTNGANGAGLQLVPNGNGNSHLGVQKASLDARRRTHTPLSRRNPMSSTAEGSRLRHRGISSMTNEQYDAKANDIQSALLDSVTSYVKNSEMNPPFATERSLTVNTDNRSTDINAYSDHHFVSDTEFSGFSTPKANRKPPRWQKHDRSRTSPTGLHSHHDMLSSPSSPLYDMNQHVPDSFSPSHYAARDEESKKYISGLLAEKKEQKRVIAEKDRRLELAESQHEKRILKFEHDLDECRAEITMKKREMDKLRSIAKNSMDTLKIAEAEVEKLGTMLSNSTAQSTAYKLKLDEKTSLVDEANRRLLEQQMEISKLKEDLSSNYQKHEQLDKEHRRLTIQLRELQHELESAREYQDEAFNARKENMSLTDTISGLERELVELRLNAQPTSAGSNGNTVDIAAPAQKKNYRKYMSLQDELAQNGGEDMSGIDDLVILDKGAGGRKSMLESSDLSAKDTKNVSVGTTDSDAQELREDAVRQWMSASLDRCSSEDLVLLYEVWKRIEYCDTNAENQEKLRRELVSVFTTPYKYGLKDAIRSRANATLTRIVDNVSGEYLSQHQIGKPASSPGGLAGALANSQHTTAAVILYSVVVFCLGIITASYFNLAQPLSTSLPFGMANGTIASVVRDTGDSSSGLGLVRQILVVDDTPVNKYYPPLRKRAPRSRFGEILFYWMETLLWEDADTQIPT